MAYFAGYFFMSFLIALLLVHLVLSMVEKGKKPMANRKMWHIVASVVIAFLYTLAHV
ncbi:hypothetical protein [Butyrivibrio sp. NC2002]|uniref:hypothetical protein n=1 Tax=Butyrivibrio sp. NC2002 TaxID=1410610 RepID=UPI000AEBE359|nr:hypothetical protein [Butyrivibrio sp. NC2002]